MNRQVQVRTRRQWDRYCLWVSVGGGNFAGIIWILPALSMVLGVPLWSLPWYRGFMRLGSALLMYAVAALGCASRRRLFWVFVLPSLWLVCSVLDRIVTHNWPGLMHDLHDNVPSARDVPCLRLRSRACIR